jgi:murein endopeptidase
MAWRPGEVWFDVEPRWFCEPVGEGVAALELHAPSFARLSPAALAAPVPDGLAESRRRRAERRRRRETRRTRAAALVVGPAVLLSVAAPKVAGSPRAALEHDPPSATLKRTSVRPLAAAKRPGLAAPRAAERAPSFPTIVWRRARSIGLPYAGSLTGGTQLPVEGPGWVTWNPSRDRIPNAPHRLYGHERVVRALLEVLEGYHAANPGAPRVLVGDLSFPGGGPMDQHRSHQNGLDVDIYYPRLDGSLRPPRTPAQIDRRLAQDLVDRFVAAGAQLVFVGYRTGLRGPSEVVEPYPNHEDHLHVRFRAPGD